MEPNWVTKQAECFIHTRFAKLVERMEWDTEQANHSSLYGRKFKTEKATDLSGKLNRFAVQEDNEAGAAIRLTLLENNVINVEYLRFEPNQVFSLFRLHRRWDREHLTCNFEIEGRRLHDWEVSYEALHDFFFYELHPVVNRSQDKT